jgi:hypothetical protein
MQSNVLVPPRIEVPRLDQTGQIQPPVRQGSGAASTGGGTCRSIDTGTLEQHPTFHGSELIRVDYTTPGQPQRTVLLPGGTWTHPSDMGGTFQVWVGCSFDQARTHVENSLSSWGDPGLFSPA